MDVRFWMTPREHSRVLANKDEVTAVVATCRPETQSQHEEEVGTRSHPELRNYRIS